MRETTGRGKYAGAENGFEAASDGAESRMQVEDEELRDLIDMAILEAAEGAYLPLKERLCLRKELFD